MSRKPTATESSSQMPDKIVLLYQAELADLNRTTLNFLANHHRRTYSRTLRSVSEELREFCSQLQQCMVQHQLEFPFTFASSHMTRSETGRYVCTDELAALDFELKLRPTNIEMRDALALFQKTNGNIPTGVDSVIAYFLDMKRNEPDYYHGVRLKNGLPFALFMDKFLELLNYWGPDARQTLVSVLDFKFDRTQEPTRLQLELVFKDSHAHYLRLDLNLS